MNKMTYINFLKESLNYTEPVATPNLDVKKTKLNAITVALFGVALSSFTQAASVSIQGFTFSENAIAIGEKSITTSVNGIANGKSTIATGNGLTREEFAIKQQEAQASIDAVNAKQEEITHQKNDLTVADKTIEQLNKEINYLADKQAVIANKIQQKTQLDTQKNVLENDLVAIQNNYDNAKVTFDVLKTNDKDLYLNFTNILGSLEWTKLDGTTTGKTQLADDLKNKIRDGFGDFADQFAQQQYLNIIDGYINRQASIQGRIENVSKMKDLQNLLHPHGIRNGMQYDIISNLLKRYMMTTNLDQNGYGLYDENYNPIEGDEKAKKIIEHFSRPYYSDDKIVIKEEDLNTILLVNSSYIKAEKDNVFNALAREQFTTQIRKDVSPNYYRELGVYGYTDSEFGKQLTETLQQLTQQNLGITKLKFDVKTTTSDTSKVSPYIVDRNLGIIGIFQDITSSDFIDSSSIDSFKRFYTELQQRYASIDWNHKESAYDLDAYKQSFDKVLAYNAKINQALEIYQAILDESKKENADNAKIESLTGQLIPLKNEIIEGSKDTTNFMMGMELKYNKQWTEYYLHYADNDVQDTIQQIHSKLKIYDDKSEIVVATTNKAKEIQAAYEQANTALTNKKAELAELNKRIDALALTPEEQQNEALKQQREAEKSQKEQEKAQLEEEIRANENDLENLKLELDKTSLKDLGERSQAYGDSAFASGNDAIATGTYSLATGNNSIAMGTSTLATANDAIAIGHNTKVSGDSSIAIGKDNVIEGNQSVAVGVGNTIKSDKVMVLGNNVTVEKGFDGAVVLGNDSAAAKANPVSSYTISNKTYTFAGDNPTSTVSVGAEGKERQITNVAAGRISATSTDAINGSQLYAVTEAVNQLDKHNNALNNRVDNLSEKINKNRKRSDAGIAATAAMTNIPQVNSAGKSGIGVGVGSRGGESALSVGYSRASDNNRHLIRFSSAIDTQSKPTFGAGYMYQW